MRKQFVFLILTIMICLLTGENVQADSNPTLGWYVATFGADENDCRTSQTPCATVRAVLDNPQYQTGSTIYIEGGGYPNPSGNEESLLIDKDVTLSGGWNKDFSEQGSPYSGFYGERQTGITIASDVTSHFEYISASGGEFNPFTKFDEVDSAILATKGGIRNFGILTIHKTGASGFFGFGISNSGMLTMTESRFSANYGTGIENSGVLYMIDSEVSSVQAEVGCGGVLNIGTLIAESASITGNKTGGYGDGGLCNFGTATFTNSVIGGNVSTDKEQTSVGGISNYGTVTLINTAMINNYGYYISDIYNQGEMYFANVTFAGTMGPDPRDSIVNDGNGTIHSRNSIIRYCRGGIQSDGYNLLVRSEGCDWQAGTGDILDRDPLLDENFIPRTNSPALNAGNPNGCLAWDGTLLDTDGYGNPRWRECDMGAYEYIPPAGEIFYQYLPLIQRIPE